MRIGLGASQVVWDYIELSESVFNINSFVSALKSRHKDRNFYDRNLVVTIREVIRI